MDSNPIKHRGLLRNRAPEGVSQDSFLAHNMLCWLSREIQARQQEVDSEALIPRQVRLQRISPP